MPMIAVAAVPTPTMAEPDQPWRAKAGRWLASVRVRIVLGYVVLLAVALTVAVVVTRQVQLARLERQINAELSQEVEELRQVATEGIDPATGRPFGADASAIFDDFLRRNVPADDGAFYAIVDGRPFLRSHDAPDLFGDADLVDAWTSTTAPTRTTVQTAAGQARTLAVPLVDSGGVAGVFVAVIFPAERRAELDQVIRLIVFVGLAVLVVSTAVAWSVAGRILRPVRELTHTARRITGSDLSARIPVEGHDELAELGSTFNAMVDRLETGNRAQRQFLDDVAHELRTPITIARGHLEFLGEDPAERAETVAIVTDELDRMSRYVSDLLVLAKSEQPDFLAPERIDLGELARDLLVRMKALGPRAWTLDRAPDVGEQPIVADPDRLGQAVLNLAANAAQHTGEGAEIGLGAEITGSTVRLWVRDTGPGVDPAVAATLFNRYARGATSRFARPEGAGIGLSIVDAIARAHGGSVSVISSRGEGATFMVSIPMRPTPAPPPTIPAVTARSSGR
jgi:two-component system, OmpR family, sensor kinase